MTSRFKQVSRNVSSKIKPYIISSYICSFQMADTCLAESHNDSKKPMMFLPDKLEGVA